MRSVATSLMGQKQTKYGLCLEVRFSTKGGRCSGALTMSALG
jgi:hypothetical protein